MFIIGAPGGATGVPTEENVYANESASAALQTNDTEAEPRYENLAIPTSNESVSLTDAAHGGIQNRQQIQSQHFTVFYNGNDDLDGDGTAGDADYAQDVSDALEASYDHYVNTLGYNDPPDPDQRIPVAITDLRDGPNGDLLGRHTVSFTPGTYNPGDQEIEIDYELNVKGYATIRGTTSHEVFHAVQAGYDLIAPDWVSEGTAAWGQDDFNDGPDGWTNQANDWLANPDQRITDTDDDGDGRRAEDPPTIPGDVDNDGRTDEDPDDSPAYRTVLLWKHIENEYGRDTIREIWENMDAPESDVVPAIETATGDDFEDIMIDLWVRMYRGNWNDNSASNLRDVPTSSLTHSGTNTALQGSVPVTGVDYVEVTTQEDDFYADLGDEFDLTILAEGPGGTVVSRQTDDNASVNVSAIRERMRTATATSNSSTDGQSSVATSQQSLIGTVPPITANNTVTNADEYASFTVLASEPEPYSGGGNYDGDIEQIPQAHRFTATVNDDASATYVIPVRTFGIPTLTSAFELNGDMFVSVWPDSQAEVSAQLSGGGQSAREISTVSGVEKTELLGRTGLFSLYNAWRLEVSTTETSATDVNVATNYLEGSGTVGSNQVFPLPSNATVAPNNRNLQAGSNNSPQPIQFTVTVSTAGRPYTSGPFDEPDESHFDISIGGQQPSSVNIASHTQNEYRLVVSPPTQPSNGQYDLEVSFTDEKFGVSETATTTLPDAVSYSGSGASGATSVSLVLDSSGSMRGSKIQDARQAANQFLNPFSADDRVSVIRYDSSSSVAFPMSLFGGNESDIRSAIDNTGAFGGTNIGAGLQDARGQLDQAPDQTSQAAVLLTDGNNNAGFSDSEVVSIASTFASRGYCVYTVAFGGGADRPLLRDIASQSCGSFNDAATGADLRAVYRDISSTTSGLVTINTNTGTVGPGTTVTDSVSFDDSTDSSVISVTTGTSASSPARFGMQSATTGPTSVRLSYPNGTQVRLNSSTASGTENPQIFYTASADTETYRIEDPRPGQWTYEIVNNGSSSTSYEAEIAGSTGTTVTVVTDGQTYINGSDAELSAVLAGQNGSVSGATVTAIVETPNGTTSSVTLTEAQAGRYTGSVGLSQSGQYNATVEVSSNNVQREETLTWSVVDQSSLVTVNETDNDSAAPGGQASVTLNVSRPSGSTGSPVTSQNSATDFDSAASELARSSPDEIGGANLSAAVREAANSIRNGSTSDSSGATATSGVFGSNAGLGVYVQTTALTDGNGNTIPAANVQAGLGVFSLRAGDARALQISVDVPQNAPTGVYNGTVTLLVQGTQIEVPISVGVSEAGAAVYRARMAELTQQWRNTSPSGRTYYEGRIADQLTSIYFAANETNRVRAANADSTFASGSLRWQGQSLFLKDTGAANATYELREADATASGAVPGSSVTNITLDSSGEAIVDTAVTGTLDGEYVLVDESGDVLEFDSDGIAVDTVDPSAESQVASAAVDLSVQSLDAQLEVPVVFQTPVNVTVSSNRGAYNLTVSADSLSAQTLETVFNESFAPTVNTGDGDITIQVTSQVQTESINFSSVARGDYTLEFDVEDSTANASTSVTVRRPPQTLTSGTTHTQGRLIAFKANASAAGATYQLREADNTTSGWQVGSAVGEVTLSSRAIGVFATTNLDGDYVILDASGQPVFFNATGIANGTGTVADARFEIVPGSGTSSSPAFASGVRP